ncbi:lipid-A-disaccharide synthase [Lutimonas zeaxanthinifaciens]|uniref:lipid-A-disaccharide synthase n=1 Tax=Lutimonas zeaxanthinifaciens TaxID=3060215 RepID=UPI00265CE742|nr:lipid-A-disaccharide synthase [Lutimonas sp. YSD2104]WKK65977.1 lipid-A-disaccharide synthase [Lutimonas sp. YSD2104]
MKYYIISGEASGDLHASNLMKALKKEDDHADFRFWGGDLMLAQGGTLVKHYKDLAFMGFAEVIMNLRTILNNIKFCKKDILEYAPDALILVDYPGFNLRIAEFAKKNGITVHYYISPQIWAWKENRIKKIKRDVDQMYVILPFEREFYEDKHDFPVHFVGHPLLDAIADRKPISPEVFAEENGLNEKPIVALLPGSRKQEITKMLLVMSKMAGKFPDHQFVIAGAPGQELSFYNNFLKEENISIVENKTYDLLSVATAAVVTSGTATLETALFKVPEVVCYKGNEISYQIGKRLVNVKYISLVNLILDKEAVTELIQDDFNETNLENELFKILDYKGRESIFDHYYKLEQALGGKGASEKTAKLIIKNT